MSQKKDAHALVIRRLDVNGWLAENVSECMLKIDFLEINFNRNIELEFDTSVVIGNISLHLKKIKL